MSAPSPLDGFTREQLEDALIFLHTYDPVGYTQAVGYVQQRAAALPAGHGENHIGNAGQVVSACAPGECITCHGTVDAQGVFHEAGAA